MPIQHAKDGHDPPNRQHAHAVSLRRVAHVDVVVCVRPQAEAPEARHQCVDQLGQRVSIGVLILVSRPVHLQVLDHILELPGRQLRHPRALVHHMRQRHAHVHEVRLTRRAETGDQEAQEMHAVQEAVNGYGFGEVAVPQPFVPDGGWGV